MHTAFIHRILPCKNWFWPLMLHETTKPDLQFNLKILWVKKKKKKDFLIFHSFSAKHKSTEI